MLSATYMLHRDIRPLALDVDRRQTNKHGYLTKPRRKRKELLPKCIGTCGRSFYEKVALKSVTLVLGLLGFGPLFCYHGTIAVDVQTPI